MLGMGEMTKDEKIHNMKGGETYIVNRLYYSYSPSHVYRYVLGFVNDQYEFYGRMGIRAGEAGRASKIFLWHWSSSFMIFWVVL